MNYRDIEEAVKDLKKTDIKGKDYVEVNQRIKAFRRLCPEGAIITELLSDENGVCKFKATIFDENGKVLATGHAYEKEQSSFINKTSYIENCETSAVGRALAMLALGVDASIASAEEVGNAINNQEKPKTRKKAEAKKEEPVVNEDDSPIDEPKVKMLRAKLEEANVQEAVFCKRFGISKVEELMVSKFLKAISALDATIVKNKEEAKDE